jgi:hypothetical protein
MRELNVNEIKEVNGGGWEQNAYHWLTGRSGYGTNNLTRATVLSRGAGMVGGAFLAGYAAGTYLNNTFGISTRIVRFLD